MTPDPSLLAAIVKVIPGSRVTIIEPNRIQIRLPSDDPVNFAAVCQVLMGYDTTPAQRAA